MNKKTIALLVAIVALVGAAVGGTVAWLTDETGPVQNTFTVGDIKITLAETAQGPFKMVPGNELTKDPKVTVLANSEDCWLFVKVVKSTNLDDFISYAMATGWTELTVGSGVYYRQVDASKNAQPFDVLAGNKVTVKDTVTEAMMNALAATGATQPTLTFTAYAVQRDASLGEIDTPQEAWLLANPTP